MNVGSVVPVVLCGGSGTRLWPLSREGYPKQFLRLNNEQSLMQQTIRRLRDVPGLDTPLLVAGEQQRFVAAEQLREIGIEDASILLEPMQRNTSAAIAVAAIYALSKGHDPLLLVLPSDHCVENRSAFTAAVETACASAASGKLVTFGIPPTGPETGYGYIRAAVTPAGSARRIVQFVEKPTLHRAEQYIANGDYFWNSGMFLFRASRILEELAKFEPEVLKACRESLCLGKVDSDFIRLDAAAYALSPSIAIDYAVMERTPNATMVEMNAGWNDIGSWASVWEVADKDEQNNAVHGDALLQDCNDCLVHSSSRLVTGVGLSNIVIVETADAVMVIDTEKAQDAKTLVNELIERGRIEATQHRQVARPWGHYDSIGTGDRFQVKKITVKQGAKLSLQMHHHRAEHWIVVSGTAKITNGDREYLLSENQSTFIPVGVVHSLENPGKVPLELIEVQSGSYLGEDDIVRLSDRYGRA